MRRGCQVLMANQDLRNHGQSFHAPEHNYSVMAEDVQEFIDQQKLDKCVLIGHSMYVTVSEAPGYAYEARIV